MIPHFVSSNIQFPHGFFTRCGGLSRGLFTSLNCGYGKGDDPIAVAVNRENVTIGIAERFNLALPYDLAVNTQIHSNKVVFIKKPDEMCEADALVTKKKRLLLGVLTADCCPILLADHENKIIAAVHAGWRGAKDGIIQNTVRMMKEKGAKAIHAAIGPCLWAEHFSVKDDFLSAFEQDQKAHQFFLQTKKDILFDFPAYIYDILSSCALASVTKSPYDTYTEEDLFFSYRRKTHKNEPFFGVQLSVIGLS
ncbi:MAG: Polyphenol oxidase [Holosporales bacterium]